MTWGVEDAVAFDTLRPSPGAADLLGGAAVLNRSPVDALDTHDLLLEGLPGEALSFLASHLRVLQASSLERALGMSLRTFQRRRDAPEKPLSQDQSGRAWKFAEVLARAMAVFGSRDEAEAWLARPAMGLDGRRPLDLLATPPGVELVEQFLTRLEYGVYM